MDNQVVPVREQYLAGGDQMSDLKETLYQEFKDGKYESVSYLQNRRQEIREVTGLTVPRRAVEAENWYQSKKATLSRKLNPANSDEGPVGEDSEADESSDESDQS